MKSDTKLKQFLSWYEFMDDSDLDTLLSTTLANVLGEYNKTTVYPAKYNIFRAFRTCGYPDVKVVMLGQDPYPNVFNNKPSACGLCFVTENGYINPSARIMLKELDRIGSPTEDPSDFINWAKQGVLMLNTALTVRHKEPKSHQKLWYFWMKAILTKLSRERSDLVWLLMGKDAQNYANDVMSFGLTVKVPHPMVDVYSSRNNFVGSDVFNRVNKELIKLNKEPIIW